MDTLEDTLRWSCLPLRVLSAAGSSATCFDRDEIASCLEKAYTGLSCAKAAQLLMLEPSALKAYAEEVCWACDLIHAGRCGEHLLQHGWDVKADRVDFASETVEKLEVSSPVGRLCCVIHVSSLGASN